MKSQFDPTLVFHIVLLVLDATQGVTEQDRILAQKISDDGRACVIICNKWDAVVDKDSSTYDKSVKYFRDELPQVRWAPILFTSAATGQRCGKIYGAVDEAVKAHRKRVSTGVLNEVLRDALLWQPPPARRNGAQAKIYYCNQVCLSLLLIVLAVQKSNNIILFTLFGYADPFILCSINFLWYSSFKILQVSIRPPTIITFVNDPKLLNDNYRRYLDRKFRESVEGFEATPIRWIFRGRRVRDIMKNRAMNGNPGDGGKGTSYPFPYAD